MTKNKLLKMLNVNLTQLEEIKSAVAEAEKNTSGEIALTAAAQSDTYVFVELFVSLCAAFVSFFILVLFSNSIWRILEHTVWFPTPSQLTAVIGTGAALVVFILYLIMNIPAIDRLIIPSKLKTRRVYERALRRFVESGVYKTAEHAGILIFISVLERKVFVIADEGINGKVRQSEWNKICALITSGLKSKRTAEALISAVKECGRILHEHFPNKGPNLNELPDGLVLLER